MQVLGGLLRSYRARLPPTTWRTICMHFMHVLEQHLLDCRRAQWVPDQPDPEGGMSQHTVLRLALALVQQMLCVLHAVMHEAPRVLFLANPTHAKCSLCYCVLYCICCYMLYCCPLHTSGGDHGQAIALNCWRNSEMFYLCIGARFPIYGGEIMHALYFLKQACGCMVT